MTTAEYVARHVFPAAFGLLPPQMDSPQARAMLLAIGWQESRFSYRRQVEGPARGFWQFERDGGVVGVMEHYASRVPAGQVLSVLGYPPDRQAIWQALEHNDVLAACWARLLLWTDPRLLPQSAEASDDGWQFYLRTWRPCKPHPQTWADFYRRAWGSEWPGYLKA